MTKVCDEAEADLRSLLDIPSDYAVLFLQGGGTTQFAAVPFNLCGNGEKPVADFVVTGTWSVKAIEEANKYLTANEAVNAKVPHFSRFKHKAISNNKSLVHYAVFM